MTGPFLKISESNTPRLFMSESNTSPHCISELLGAVNWLYLRNGLTNQIQVIFCHCLLTKANNISKLEPML